MMKPADLPIDVFIERLNILILYLSRRSCESLRCGYENNTVSSWEDKSCVLSTLCKRIA